MRRDPGVEPRAAARASHRPATDDRWSVTTPVPLTKRAARWRCSRPPARWPRASTAVSARLAHEAWPSRRRRTWPRRTPPACRGATGERPRPDDGERHDDRDDPQITAARLACADSAATRRAATLPAPVDASLAALLTRRSAVTAIRDQHVHPSALEGATNRRDLAAAAGNTDHTIDAPQIRQVDAMTRSLSGVTTGAPVASKNRGRCRRQRRGCSSDVSSSVENTLPLDASSFDGSTAPMPTSATRHRLEQRRRLLHVAILQHHAACVRRTDSAGRRQQRGLAAEQIRQPPRQLRRRGTPHPGCRCRRESARRARRRHAGWGASPPPSRGAPRSRRRCRRRRAASACVSR